MPGYRLKDSVHDRIQLRERRKHLRNNATLAELTLWQCLRASKLEGRKFRRQASIGTYIVDFYCPSEQLAIEVDGEIHELPKEKQKDRIRDILLDGNRIQVLRITNEEVSASIESVLEMIKGMFKKE
jgi:very-short-patch-repair endonuclease